MRGRGILLCPIELHSSKFLVLVLMSLREEFLLSQSVAVANLCVPVTLFTQTHENLDLVNLKWKISGGFKSLHNE